MASSLELRCGSPSVNKRLLRRRKMNIANCNNIVMSLNSIPFPYRSLAMLTRIFSRWWYRHNLRTAHTANPTQHAQEAQAPNYHKKEEINQVNSNVRPKFKLKPEQFPATSKSQRCWYYPLGQCFRLLHNYTFHMRHCCNYLTNDFRNNLCLLLKTLGNISTPSTKSKSDNHGRS